MLQIPQNLRLKALKWDVTMSKALIRLMPRTIKAKRRNAIFKAKFLREKLVALFKYDTKKLEDNHLNFPCQVSDVKKMLYFQQFRHTSKLQKQVNVKQSKGNENRQNVN